MDRFLLKTPNSRKRNLTQESQEFTPFNTAPFTPQSTGNSVIMHTQQNLLAQIIPEETRTCFLDGISRTEYVNRLEGIDGLTEIEQLRKLLELGNEKDDIIPGFQKIVFDEEMTSQNYRLLEVDASELDDILDSSNQLVFRGAEDSELTLCTSDKTFRIKENGAGTTLMLLPELKSPTFFNEFNCNQIHQTIVMGIKQEVLSLRRVEIHDKKAIKAVFRETELGWPEGNNSSENELAVKSKIRLPDLLDRIQISECELLEIMKTLPIIKENGYYYLMSYIYQDQLINKIVLAIDDDSFPNLKLDNISFPIVRNIFSEKISDGAIRWFITNFCVQKNESHYTIDEKKFVIYIVDQLLRSQHKMDLESFKLTLDTMLPTYVHFKKDIHLEGVGIIKKENTVEYIHHISLESLPLVPNDRLKLLFAMQENWPSNQLYPFLYDICGNQKSCDEMLLKNCRSVKQKDGTKLYVGMKFNLD
uniref:Sister chromatid cohesion protein DCC1 n=1 Tax=Rhabditophanes sp. KR3021 TaxID=114890 RepID=A0AC35UBI0_9BILA